MKIALLELKISREDLICGMSEIEIMLEKESIFLQLNEFKGYNAKDFFIVNKSMITGMTSNFGTYLIILIEFKLTEMSLQDNNNQQCDTNQTDFKETEYWLKLSELIRSELDYLKFSNHTKLEYY